MGFEFFLVVFVGLPLPCRQTTLFRHPILPARTLTCLNGSPAPISVHPPQAAGTQCHQLLGETLRRRSQDESTILAVLSNIGSILQYHQYRTLEILSISQYRQYRLSERLSITLYRQWRLPKILSISQYRQNRLSNYRVIYSIASTDP